jgi:hypothetical protein
MTKPKYRVGQKLKDLRTNQEVVVEEYVRNAYWVRYKHLWSDWRRESELSPLEKTLDGLEVDDVLERDNCIYRVLAVTGNLVAISKHSNWGEVQGWYTKSFLNEAGYTLKQEKVATKEDYERWRTQEPKVEGWEKEFDEKFKSWEGLNLDSIQTRNVIKDHFRSLISKEKKR